MSRPGYVDKRGNVADRAARRAWLLATFDQDLGVTSARCAMRLSRFCEGVVDAATLSVNRIEPGGTYARHNIEPACKPCQDRQGGLLGQRAMAWLFDGYRDARRVWENRFEEVTGKTYVPGIIRREARKARRGGRNEVTDYVEENPPPMLTAWLREQQTEDDEEQRYA